MHDYTTAGTHWRPVSPGWEALDVTWSDWRELRGRYWHVLCQLNATVTALCNHFRQNIKLARTLITVSDDSNHRELHL